MLTLNCKGKIISLESPLVMGIINATGDSFYKGDLQRGIEGMVQLAGMMITDGADIIDIGGQSTRPGSKRIGLDEELERVLPVIKAIHNQYPEILISSDTYQSKVAMAAIHAGAHIINDISGGLMDEAMIKTVGSLHVPYICTHMKGTPETMQDDARYENVVKDVMDFFIKKIDECNHAGIHDIILDPGFGFAKLSSHNFILLKHLRVFCSLGKPVLTGLSRKSTIYKTLAVPVEEALNGTTVLHTIALLNGANILRVHDVKEAVEVVKLFQEYRKCKM